MIMEVVAHAGKIGQHWNAEFFELLCWTNSGEKQQTRRTDRTGADDDLFAGERLVELSLLGILNSPTACALKDESMGFSIRHDGQIGPAQCRAKIGPGDAIALAILDCEIEIADPLHLAGIIVLDHWQADLPTGFKECPRKRIGLARQLYM